MSDETTLEHLLALNLHEVEDDVRNIVDKATKELSMEKSLKVLLPNLHICLLDRVCGEVKWLISH